MGLVGLATVTILTATAAHGSEPPFTPPSVPLPPPPRNVEPVSIGGVLVRGGTLTAYPGVWAGEPTAFTYAWFRCPSSTGTADCLAVGDGPRYTVTFPDENAYLRVAGVATGLGGSSAVSWSAAAGPVYMVFPLIENTFHNHAPPTISGVPRVGNPLLASEGLWIADPPAFAPTFQWFRCVHGCEALVGANAPVYTPQSADVGAVLKVRVTGAARAGIAESTSAPTLRVARRLESLVPVALSLGAPEFFNPWETIISNPLATSDDIPRPTGESLVSPLDPASLAVAIAAAHTGRKQIGEGTSNGQSPPPQMLEFDNPYNPSDTAWYFGSFTGIGEQALQGNEEPTITSPRVPDAGGGVGTQYFVQAVNWRIDIWDKYNIPHDPDTENVERANPIHLKSTLLSTMFNWQIDPATGRSNPSPLPNNQFTDPRVLKDPETGHWFAVAISQQTGRSQLFLAVSRTDDARGKGPYTQYPWARFKEIDTRRFLNPANYSEAPGVVDFPTLGINHDALIVTLNVTDAGGDRVIGSTVLTFPKAQLISVAQAGVNDSEGRTAPEAHVQSGLPPLLSPPIVRDGNTTAYFVAPIVGTYASPVNRLVLYQGTGLGSKETALMSPKPDVTTPPYYVPDAVYQCQSHINGGGPFLQSTPDTRFGAPSVQLGTFLWQVHTVNRGADDAAPRSRFYEIDASSSSLRRAGSFGATSTSDDFNASITVDSDGYAFTTWSSTEPHGTSCNGPQIRFSGLRPYPTDLTIGPGDQFRNSMSDASISSTFLDNNLYTRGEGAPDNRWGDFSSVTADPSALTFDASSRPSARCRASAQPAYHRAWVTNEKATGLTRWSTHIGAVGYC